MCYDPYKNILYGLKAYQKKKHLKIKDLDINNHY